MRPRAGGIDLGRDAAFQPDVGAIKLGVRRLRPYHQQRNHIADGRMDLVDGARRAIASVENRSVGFVKPSSTPNDSRRWVPKIRRGLPRSIPMILPRAVKAVQLNFDDDGVVAIHDPANPSSDLFRSERPDVHSARSREPPHDIAITRVPEPICTGHCRSYRRLASAFLCRSWCSIGVRSGGNTE